MSHSRRPAPLPNQASESIKLDDFLKQFKGTGTHPKTQKLQLRPEIVKCKLD